MTIFLSVIALFFLSVATALDQAYIDEFIEKMTELAGTCAKETGATSDDIAELIANKFPPSTHEGKCMIFCFNKHLNMMKEDGSIDKSGAMEFVKDLKPRDPELYQKVLKIFITCGMRVKPQPDPCDTATSLAICGHEQAIAMGLEELLVF